MNAFFSWSAIRMCWLPLAAFCLTATGLRAQTADELIRQADVHDVALQPDQALPLYLQAEKMDPNNSRVLVRIARQYRHLMPEAKGKSEKLRLGNLALAYGERAAKLSPKDSDAQLSAAISYGKMLPYLGTKEQMEASKRIKASADKAIELDSRNDLAWHIVGRWHRVLAEVGSIKRALAALVYDKLPEASNEDAEKCFVKAIAINPNRLMHHIELGIVYARMGKNAEAKQCIEKGLAMPSQEKDDPDFKSKGKAELATLKE